MLLSRVHFDSHCSQQSSCQSVSYLNDNLEQLSLAPGWQKYSNFDLELKTKNIFIEVENTKTLLSKLKILEQHYQN